MKVHSKKTWPTSLQERRTNIYKDFFIMFMQIIKPDHKLNFLLPAKGKQQLSLRKVTPIYQMPKVRTERVKHSTINYGPV